MAAQPVSSTWPLSAWIAASFVLAISVPALAWLLARSRAPVPAVARVAAWPGTAAIAWLAAGLFYLLVPVAAWRAGALSPYYLGMAENDWLAAIGAGGGLALLIVVLVLASWLVYRRSLRAEPFAAWSCCEDLAPGERWSAPVSAGLAQWHWAFYRAAAITWLAAGAAVPATLAARLPGPAAWATSVLASWQAQPVYWGSWLGLGLVGLEWCLNPFTWHDLRTPGRLEGALRAAGLAVATTALFALTRNFWLCLACSLAVEIAIAGWFPISTGEMLPDRVSHHDAA